MMKWPSYLAILCSLLLGARPAVALDLKCDTAIEETPDSQCVVMNRQGMRGVWFELGVANELRRNTRLLDGLQLQLNKYSMITALAEKEASVCREQVAVLESTRLKLEKQVELATSDARKAREELASGRRWYTSPIFWGITMFIAGAAIQNVCCSGK